MSDQTDLTKTRRNDHPCNVLGESMVRGTTEPGQPGIIYAASSIAVLNAYEAEHGVTFEALDDQGLTDARRAFEDFAERKGSEITQVEINDLITLHRAVGDLFGWAE